MTTKSQYMIWLLFLSLFSCNDPAPDAEPTGITVLEGYSFPYKLGKPDQTFEMPDELDEISGLGLSDDGNTLAAVQDEDGEIFLVNRYTGEVQAEIDFWKDGDYEGIEFVGDNIYVVKSSGTIYEVLRPGGEQQVTNKYNYFLDGDNDVEGLAYDAAHHRLLLACKGSPAHDKAYPGRKGVYAFDLEEKMLQEEPVYFVALDSVRHYLGQSPAIWKLEKLMEFFNPDEEFGFSPSAISIHPLSGYLYMTSSVGKMLLVMQPDGQIVHIEKLNKRVHVQPEGLCFDQKGNLFLSNEGKGTDPVIYRFNYKPRH
jgi:uncharacterized protein YjiK